MWWIWLLVGFSIGFLGACVLFADVFTVPYVGTLKIGDPITIRIDNAGPLNRYRKTVAFKVDYTDIRESNNDYSDN